QEPGAHRAPRGHPRRIRRQRPHVQQAGPRPDAGHGPARATEGRGDGRQEVVRSRLQRRGKDGLPLRPDFRRFVRIDERAAAEADRRQRLERRRMMDYRTLAIPLGFILLAALLCWWVIGTKGAWWKKLLAIVFVPTFGLAVWHALPTYLGWPS